MSKYYRVRNRQEWNWLAKELGLWETELGYKFPAIIQYEQGNDYSSYGIVKEHKGPEPVVEVSQIMGDEKMEDYVTISGEDLKKTEIFFGSKSNGNLRDFCNADKINISKSLLYPKVQFTEAEKAEFDSIREEETLYNALDFIELEHCPHLYKRIYGHTSASVPELELEFARAWVDPSLIEVLPEKKWNVLVPRTNNLSYFKVDENQINWGFKDRNNRDDHQFTTEELKHYGLDNDLFEKVEVQE